MPVEEMVNLPLFLKGEICRGFRRGAAELGIPTANFNENVVQQLPSDFQCGIYFGYAQVGFSPIYKSVTSIGYNPYYKNHTLSVETHIFHEFSEDLYDLMLKVVLLGYIRPQEDFPSLDTFIQAIKNDIAIASNKLEETEYVRYRIDPFFTSSENTKNYCSKTKL